MKLNTLDQATKLYKAIKDLDAEIMAIEKRANELANGNFEVTAKFTFKNLDQKEKVKFDEDGSIVVGGGDTSYPRFSFQLFGMPSSIVSNESQNSFDVKINEREALYMISALLQIKNDERKGLIKAIRDLGYN